MTPRHAATASSLHTTTQAAARAAIHAGMALAAVLGSAASLFTGPSVPRAERAPSRSAAEGGGTAAPSVHEAATLSMVQAFDGALRDTLLARLAQQPGWRRETANVFVADGVAVYQGLFSREAERDASAAVARRLPGIRAVRDDRVRAREWHAMV